MTTVVLLVLPVLLLVLTTVINCLVLSAHLPNYSFQEPEVEWRIKSMSHGVQAFLTLSV